MNIFTTSRLILRPWKESDAKSLYQYARDPRVGPRAGWQVHTSEEDSLNIIKNVLSVDENYAICLKEDNLAIGCIGLKKPGQTQKVLTDFEIEVGYWLGVPFWGKGYVPEALSKIQEHVFLDLNVDILWCGYFDGNIQSKRCMEKCGFVYHHSEENKLCVLLNEVKTEHYCMLTKEQWQNKNKGSS